MLLLSVTELRDMSMIASIEATDNKLLCSRTFHNFDREIRLAANIDTRLEVEAGTKANMPTRWDSETVWLGTLYEELVLGERDDQ